MLKLGLTLVYLLHIISPILCNFCDVRDLFLINHCFNVPSKLPTTYLLYDVNPMEGFNLRRDVYLRMATFARELRKRPAYSNSKLILPPFTNMYHWHSRGLDQDRVFWSHFFDLESLRKFTDVLDFPEFLAEVNSRNPRLRIEEVYRLQNFVDMFENGVFVDKFEKSECSESETIRRGAIFGYNNISLPEVTCVNFQGGAKLLYDLLERFRSKGGKAKDRIVLFLNAEVVLHDFWGTSVFWSARRSMRFSRKLTKVADQFRKRVFKSINEQDGVQRPSNWLDERPFRGAKGGEYLAVHLRRADFLYGREKTTPTLDSAATQIRQKLRELNLTRVYIASDCTGNEFNDLKERLRHFKVTKFRPESNRQREELKDGGMAIIDQIICSHARYFIGTYESTFTFRIYEEREILGFPKEMTFNTFCKREDRQECEKNSAWTIIW